MTASGVWVFETWQGEGRGWLAAMRYHRVASAIHGIDRAERRVHETNRSRIRHSRTGVLIYFYQDRYVHVMAVRGEP